MVGIFDLPPDTDFSLFDADERRNIIRNTLPGLIEEGYSQRASRNLYRSVGLGISNTDFGSIFREITGEEIRAQRIRYVNKDSIPSDDIFETQKYDQPSLYRYIGRYSIYSPDKGTEQGFFAYDSDYKSSIGEIEADLYDTLVSRYPDLETRITGLTIVKGFINR